MVVKVKPMARLAAGGRTLLAARATGSRAARLASLECVEGLEDDVGIHIGRL